MKYDLHSRGKLCHMHTTPMCSVVKGSCAGGMAAAQGLKGAQLAALISLHTTL